VFTIIRLFVSGDAQKRKNGVVRWVLTENGRECFVIRLEQEEGKKNRSTSALLQHLEEIINISAITRCVIPFMLLIPAILMANPKLIQSMWFS
jgi:hypothetical protein